MRAGGIATVGDLAVRIGVDRSHLYKILANSVTPGGTAIAATLTAFPEYTFEQLFEVVPR